MQPVDDPSLTSPPPDLFELSGKIVRVACQLVGLLLILLGAFYVLNVFSAVGGVIAKPEGIEALPKAISQAIDADRMVVKTETTEVAFGKAVAMLFTLLWYLLWAWIPLALLYAGGKLVWWTMQDVRQGRELAALVLKHQAARPAAAPPVKPT
jgi:hypothetical protein